MPYNKSHGSGDGSGYGYGSGYGDGDGSGDGSGSGYGSGYGDGYGDGSGDGSGSGYGSGDGDKNDWKKIGEVDHGDGYGKYEALHLFPWPYVRVGCEIHRVDFWRAHWREIAKKNKVIESEELVLQLLAKVEEKENA